MMVYDPLDALDEHGIRLVWVDGLDSGVLLLRHERLVIADPSWSRRTVARAALDLWESPRRPLRVHAS